MSADKARGESEISFSFSVLRLGADGEPLRFEADAEERAAIARRFGILGVERFEADLLAKPWQAGGVCVEGRFVADVVQSDVVTLDPVPQSIDEELQLFFVPEHSRLARPANDDLAEVDVDLAEDEPETFRGDRVDLGEALVQFLGLALDPYPRAADVEEFAARRRAKDAA